MLKLAKSSTNGLEIRFRKTTRFSTHFLKAIAIALGCHLGFFVLFRIAVPLYNKDLPPSLPTPVEIDLGKIHPSVNNSKTVAFFLGSEIPLLPPFPSARFFPTTGEISDNEPDFSMIEKIPYTLLEE